jgi:hypothetical protein
MCSTSEAKASSDAIQDNSGKTSSINNSTSNENTSSIAETTATAETATTLDSTKIRVNWLDNLPRELRNDVYVNALPADIVFHDGVLCSDVANILSIDRGSRQEGLEEMRKMRETRHFVFEFTSNATMLKYLDALPDNSLKPYTNLTITVKGPYNGHSNIYSNNNGCHRTNISPTLRRVGDEVWFEVVYACPDCRHQPFYQRELQFTCPTVQAGFERLTGMAFTAGVVDLRISTYSHDDDVPHVRAYRLSVCT